MDWLAFIASLVGSLAWPVLVIVLAFLFRSELKPLLRRPIHRAKAGPVEVEWEQTVGEARVLLAISPEAAEQPSPEPRARAGGEEPTPRDAILSAFAGIEQDLRRTLTDLNVDVGAPGRQGMSQIVDQAVAARVISEQTAEAIRRLIVLRNLAAHGTSDDLDQAKAEEFIDLAEAVAYALRAARDADWENPDNSEPP